MNYKFKKIKNIINESYKRNGTIRKITGMSSGYGSGYDSIVNTLTECMYEYMQDNYSCDILKNATDLRKCDSDEIGEILSIYDEDEAYEYYDDVFKKPYSIKEFIKKYYSHYAYIPIFENVIKENYEDWLDDDQLETFYDIQDIASISDKYALNGGGYEMMMELCFEVAHNVTEKLKAAYIKGYKIKK